MININGVVILCLDRCLFLAGEAQYVHMGRRFRRGGGGIDWTELLLPIAVIACVAGIAWLVSRYFKLRAERNADSPQALFAELCHAHGLDWPQQQLLRTLAKAHRLPAPQLFIAPELFDVKRFGTAFERRTKQVAVLRSRLFADSAGEGHDAS